MSKAKTRETTPSIAQETITKKSKEEIESRSQPKIQETTTSTQEVTVEPNHEVKVNPQALPISSYSVNDQVRVLDLRALQAISRSPTSQWAKAFEHATCHAARFGMANKECEIIALDKIEGTANVVNGFNNAWLTSECLVLIEHASNRKNLTHYQKELAEEAEAEAEAKHNEKIQKAPQTPLEHKLTAELEEAHRQITLLQNELKTAEIQRIEEKAKYHAEMEAMPCKMCIVLREANSELERDILCKDEKVEDLKKSFHDEVLT